MWLSSRISKRGAVNPVSLSILKEMNNDCNNRDERWDLHGGGGELDGGHGVVVFAETAFGEVSLQLRFVS